MADARYQVARVRDGAIQDVIAEGTSLGITTGADTTVELGSIIDTRELYDPVRMYVEAVSGVVLVKRSAGHIWWRIPVGGYAWFTLIPGYDLIMRQGT